MSMEENENQCKNSQNWNSFSMNICSHAAVLSSDPLFSTLATLYLLILLYFPRIFFKIIFSPVLLITFALLLTLVRLGAKQRNHENKENSETNCTPEPTVISGSDYLDQDRKWVACIDTSFDQNTCFEESFVEWNVRAPLEVIHEAYEGEEEEEEIVKDRNNEKDPGNRDPSRFSIDRYPSLSLYYPDTDSDTSSDGDFSAIADWGSPDSVCYRWEDEDREGLIEIALDHGAGANSNNNKRESSNYENFHGEEENNLIEIDIWPVKNEEKWRSSDESRELS